ncbi:MAG TPA: TIGR03618 family F420-dependent PPOX class oxidoreductase [Acidimicrobiales bacterium]|nr:TIGR03618 family F420-dependent PPOX class oxidoreductase [Acidimicrobiales bacterium]
MNPSEALEFLRANHRSVLMVHRSGGQVAPSPVVHGVDDRGRVVISSRQTAYKVRNLKRDPRATLCGFTDGFFGPWVTVSGPAEIIPLPDAMDGLVDLYRQVAGEHPDWDDFQAAMEREQRVLIAIRPETAGPDVRG